MKKIILCALMLLASLKSNSQTTWTPNKKVMHKTDTTAGSNEKKFQCWGTTKKGERCKRKVETDHSFCYQHAGQK